MSFLLVVAVAPEVKKWSSDSWHRTSLVNSDARNFSLMFSAQVNRLVPWSGSAGAHTVYTYWDRWGRRESLQLRAGLAVNKAGSCMQITSHMGIIIYKITKRKFPRNVLRIYYQQCEMLPAASPATQLLLTFLWSVVCWQSRDADQSNGRRTETLQ